MEKHSNYISSLATRLLERSPVHKYDRLGAAAPVIMEINLHDGAVWFITGGELLPNEDWLLYGYGGRREQCWGYIKLEDVLNSKGANIITHGDGSTVKSLAVKYVQCC